MNIQKINHRHRTGLDLHYRAMKGLSSKLLKYRNGVIYIEVVLSPKWSKDYNAAVSEVGNLWRKEYEELQSALACKVYIKEMREEDLLFDRPPALRYVAKKGFLFSKNHLN